MLTNTQYQHEFGYQNLIEYQYRHNFLRYPLKRNFSNKSKNTHSLSLKKWNCFKVRKEILSFFVPKVRQSSHFREFFLAKFHS